MSKQPDDHKREFHIEEYKQLSEAYASRIEEALNTLKYAVISSATVVTWLTATDHRSSSNVQSIAWWLPSIFCSFAFLRDRGINVQLHLLEHYMRIIERRYGQIGLGYRKFNNRSINKGLSITPILQLTDIRWFYGVLLVCCTALALWHAASS